MSNGDDPLRAGVKFAGHVVMATIVFAIVTVAAVGLGYFLAWVHNMGDDIVPEYVQHTLKIVKFGLFAVDIGGYVLYVGTMSISFAVSVVRAMVSACRRKD